MTPLDIEIGLHYYAIAVEFPRAEAPACKEAIARFVAAGLLEDAGPQQHPTPRYKATRGLHLWVEALLQVPWPKPWRVAETKTPLRSMVENAVTAIGVWQQTCWAGNIPQPMREDFRKQAVDMLEQAIRGAPDAWSKLSAQPERTEA